MQPARAITMVAPERFAWASTASTSASLRTLWPGEHSVAWRGCTGSPASWARLARSHTASLRPG